MVVIIELIQFEHGKMAINDDEMAFGCELLNSEDVFMGFVAFKTLFGG